MKELARREDLAIKEVPLPTPDSNLVTGRNRFVGLDSIRFVCAFVVVVSHLGMIPLYLFASPDSNLYWSLKHLLPVFVNGPASVIVFFVISGFCIHSTSLQPGFVPKWPAFLARRYLRLLPPWIAISMVAIPIGLPPRAFENWILWSLVCELVYYTVYPFVWAARRRWGFPLLILVSFIAALTVAFSNRTTFNYPNFGRLGNSVLGFPCWLLGCYLAELATRPRAAPNAVRVWSGRIVVFAVSALVQAINFHTPVHNPLMLNFFALLVFFWLRDEIKFRETYSPPRFLEKAGAFSYSLYLAHVPVIVACQIFLPRQIGPINVWWVQLSAVFAGAYLLYFLVEKPSHELARMAGAWLARNA